MNTQYRKNLKAVLEANKQYTDNKIDELKWELGTYDLSVDNDSNVAYQKSVPSGAIDCMINKIGGMSYKYNQLYNPNNEVLGTTIDGITFTNNNDGTFTLNGTATETIVKDLSAFNRTAVGNSVVLYGFVNLSNAITGLSLRNQYSYASTTTTRLETITNSQIAFAIRIASGTILNNVKVAVECISLTQDFGAGNEPSDVASAIPLLQARGYKLDGTDTYNAGSIRDSAVSSVVSKDSNDTTLDTLTIDNNIQALNGYGWGINENCYNYIDFENKKFIQKVGRVDLGTLSYTKINATGYFYAVLSGIKIISSGTPNLLNDRYSVRTAINGTEVYGGDKWITQWSTLNRILINDTSYATAEAFTTAMSGVYLYYELATPVETDISQYITTNKVIVEENGTLTFTNTYNQAVPSDVDYLIEEVKA